MLGHHVGRGTPDNLGQLGGIKMLKIDSKQMVQLGRELNKLRSRSVPFAVRQTLNDQAFGARTRWTTSLKKQWAVRTAYLPQRNQVVKAEGFDVARMAAVLGSRVDYMKHLEETGVTKGKSGRFGVAIPAAPKAKRNEKRAKGWAPNRLNAIKLPGVRFKGGRQTRNAGTIAYLARKGGGVGFLNLGKNKGLYRISGSEGSPKIRKVWDLSKSAIRVKPKPALEPAAHAVRGMTQAMFEAQLRRQLAWCKRIGPRQGG